MSAGRVAGDARALARVVRNVADNAARHAAGSIAFTIEDRDGSVTFTIDDDGRGVPPEARTRVFDRFVRLDDAWAQDEGGSGLGLAIVAELVHAHGGVVTLGESPTGGARLFMRFPAFSAASGSEAHTGGEPRR